MYSYKYQSIVKFIAFLCILTGAVVAVGWLCDSKELVTLFRGYSPMKINTALCLILSGCSFLFFLSKGKNNLLLYKISSFTLLAIAGFSLLGNIFGFNLLPAGRILSHDINVLYKPGHFAGRMSPATSFCFTMVGLYSVGLPLKNILLKKILQWLLHVATLVSVVALMAHIYQVPGFDKMVFFSPMAVHTALFIFSISVTASLINPSLGITGLFTADKIGSEMARRLFPMIAFLLLSITYLRLEVFRHTSLGMEFTSILFTTFVILVNLLLIWRTALQLNKVDIKRKTAEESVQVLNKNFEQKVEHRTITLKEALQQLEKSKIELSERLNKEKELSKIKSRFVSMASHEFRTPLSTILSSASLIACYPDAEGQAKRDRHVQRITNAVMHLNGLLEEFLSLGTLEAGNVSIYTTPVGLKEFMLELIEEMKTLLKPGQIIRLNQLGANEFITDKRLLKNILANILSNAIKFSPADSEIIVQLNNNEHGLYIAVEDRGIGISREDQEHLFTSFFRGANALDIQGTGLGLHIVKRYVDLLKGNIDLHSELASGTTITVKLPQLQEKAA